MITAVIVSSAYNEKLKKITQKAVFGARQDNCQVVVIESENVKYHMARTVHFKQDEFNYNRALNKGAVKVGTKYIAFCNNDLVFKSGWTGIIEHMEKYGFESGSPYCEVTHPQYYSLRKPDFYQGTRPRALFAGWCFVWTKQLYQRIGPLPEDYSFFCADNDTVKLMRKNNVTHALFTKFTVNHLGSKTLHSVSVSEQKKLTVDQVKKYNRKYNENVLNWRI